MTPRIRSTKASLPKIQSSRRPLGQKEKGLGWRVPLRRTPDSRRRDRRRTLLATPPGHHRTAPKAASGWNRRTPGAGPRPLCRVHRQRGRRVQVDVTTDAPVIGFIFDDLAPNRVDLEEVAGASGSAVTIEPVAYRPEQALQLATEIGMGCERTHESDWSSRRRRTPTNQPNLATVRDIRSRRPWRSSSSHKMSAWLTPVERPDWRHDRSRRGMGAVAARDGRHPESSPLPTFTAKVQSSDGQGPSVIRPQQQGPPRDPPDSPPRRLVAKTNNNG